MSPDDERFLARLTTFVVVLAVLLGTVHVADDIVREEFEPGGLFAAATSTIFGMQLYLLGVVLSWRQSYLLVAVLSLVGLVMSVIVGHTSGLTPNHVVVIARTTGAFFVWVVIMWGVLLLSAFVLSGFALIRATRRPE